MFKNFPILFFQYNILYFQYNILYKIENINIYTINYFTIMNDQYIEKLMLYTTIYKNSIYSIFHIIKKSTQKIPLINLIYFVHFIHTFLSPSLSIDLHLHHHSLISLYIYLYIYYILPFGCMNTVLRGHSTSMI